MKLKLILTTTMVGAVLALPAASSAAQFAYVPNTGNNNISQFRIGAGGELSPLSPATVAAGGGADGAAVAPNGKSVYVTNFGDGTVSQYDINPQTGALSPKVPATVASGDQPYKVAVSPNGKSAYVSNSADGTVSQYDIDQQTGALSPKVPATVTTGAFPWSIAISPEGGSAYVANYSYFSPTTVSQYDIDPKSGALSPKTPATVATGRFTAEIALTPDGKSAYAVQGGFAEIGQFDINPQTGTLTPKVPATVFAPGAAFAAVTPDGTSAYFTNNGDNIVLQYSIDPQTGTLSPKTPSAVAAVGPQEITVNPDGKSVYAANVDGDTVSQYSIDPQTGTLTPKVPASVAVGAGPEDIAVTPLTRTPTTRRQCKDGGWRNFPQFKNQGQCVAFVNQGPKKRGAGLSE